MFKHGGIGRASQCLKSVYDFILYVVLKPPDIYQDITKIKYVEGHVKYLVKCG